MNQEQIKNEIQEKIESLRAFCNEHGRQLLIISDVEGHEDGRYLNVWSIATSKHKELDGENASELLGPFFHAIGSFVTRASGGNLTLTQQEAKPEQEGA